MIEPEDIFNAIWYIIKIIITLILIDIILFYLGFLVLKIFTLCKYPPAEMIEKDKIIVIYTGALTPFFIFGCFFVFNNYIA